MAENTTATNTLQYVGQVKVTKLKKGKKVRTTKTKNSGTLLLSQLLTYMLVRTNKLDAMPSFIDLGSGDYAKGTFKSGLFARAPITGWQYKTYVTDNQDDPDNNKPYAYFRALIPGRLISANQGSYNVLLLCNASSEISDSDYGVLAYANLTGDDPISTDNNKDVSYLIEWTMRIEFEAQSKDDENTETSGDSGTDSNQ